MIKYALKNWNYIAGPLLLLLVAVSLFRACEQQVYESKVSNYCHRQCLIYGYPKSEVPFRTNECFCLNQTEAKKIGDYKEDYHGE